MSAGPPQNDPSDLPGTVHYTSPATLANGQQSVLLSDTAGNLNVNLAASSGGSISVISSPYVFASAGSQGTLTVTSGSAVLLSSVSGGIPAGTKYATIANEGGAYRYRDDGTAPTTTVGSPVSGGTATNPGYQPYSGPFAALQFIAQSASALLTVSFYK